MKQRLLQLLVFGILLGGLGWRMSQVPESRENGPTVATADQLPFADLPLLDRTKPPEKLAKQDLATLPPLLGEAELRARMSRSTAGLVAVTRPDGGRSVNLAGRFTTFSAGVKQPDGTLKVQCFSSVDALKTALSQDPQSSNPTSPPSHATR